MMNWPQMVSLFERYYPALKMRLLLKTIQTTIKVHVFLSCNVMNSNVPFTSFGEYHEERQPLLR